MKFKPMLNFLFRNVPIHLIGLITSFLPNHALTTKIRGALMRPFFKKCGSGFMIASGVIINKPDKLEIGKDVYIAHNCWINANGEVKLEDHVILGPFTVIASSQHRFVNGIATNFATSLPIRVGKGTWLASHVVVTDGVTIGDGCKVAAGAVVTKDIPDKKMVGGVPAKMIGKVE